MKFKRRKGRQITRAKKHVVDGITFASGLEVYCYRALIKAKIPNVYEGKTFELMEKFKFEGFLMDKGTTKGKKVFKHFVNLDAGFIIETKGLRTPEFRMRFKLFLKLLHDSDQQLDVYIPSNQKEVDATIDLILSRGNLLKTK